MIARLLAILLLFPSIAAASMAVWADHGTIKVRQQGDYTGTGRQTVQNVSLKCAKNEFEPFQIFVYANGEDLTGVDVTVSNLTKGSDTVDDIYIYKEGYLNVTSPSRSDYQAGLWPDPLFPKVDRYYHETRNAFPFSVTSGNVQGVWVDLGTTTATAPGIYTGTYTVTANGKTPVTGTITLQVWDFALPSTATQKHMWMTAELWYGNGFYGSAQSTTWTANMFNLVQKSYLYHRIALNTANITNVVASDGTVSFGTTYNTTFRSLLDGTAIASGPYQGAKKAIQDIEIAANIDNQATGALSTYDTGDAKWTKYLQSYWDWYSSNGFDPMHRLFAYTIDEPNGATLKYRGGNYTDYQVILAKMADMNAVNTGGQGTWVNTFTTENRDPSGPQNALITANPSFDTNGVWCPTNMHYEWTDASGPSYRNARDSYPDYSGWPSRDHFAYNANINVTANIPTVDHNTDAPAFWTRAEAWTDWTYRNTGSVYYHTNNMWGPAGGNQPYVNTKYLGENGANTSFYPGVASKAGRTLPDSTPEIGGTHDIPIESMKMKLYREGQEDFEYMAILRGRGKTAVVDAIVNNIYAQTPYTGGYGKFYSLVNNTDTMLSARESLAASIVASSIPALSGKLSGTLH